MRRITTVVFLLSIVFLSLSSCRTRELCPAYSDNRQETTIEPEKGV
ncbi:MAG TPA: hypothetical protein VLH61_03025 [Bacteroidales bacterium]|nr:hypothetical protein [Bacteroidales bacterium]